MTYMGEEEVFHDPCNRNLSFHLKQVILVYEVLNNETVILFWFAISLHVKDYNSTLYKNECRWTEYANLDCSFHIYIPQFT